MCYGSSPVRGALLFDSAGENHRAAPRKQVRGRLYTLGQGFPQCVASRYGGSDLDGPSRDGVREGDAARMQTDAVVRSTFASSSPSSASSRRCCKPRVNLLPDAKPHNKKVRTAPHSRKAPSELLSQAFRPNNVSSTVHNHATALLAPAMNAQKRRLQVRCKATEAPHPTTPEPSREPTEAARREQANRTL